MSDTPNASVLHVYLYAGKDLGWIKLKPESWERVPAPDIKSAALDTLVKPADNTDWKPAAEPVHPPKEWRPGVPWECWDCGDHGFALTGEDAYREHSRHNPGCQGPLMRASAADRQKLTGLLPTHGTLESGVSGIASGGPEKAVRAGILVRAYWKLKRAVETILGGIV